MTQEAYIFDAIRTPRGRGRANGALHTIRPIELLTALFGEIECRHQLDTSQIDDLIFGCVTPVGEQGAVIPRAAALWAGWDVDTPGLQINRFCASGLEAVNLAAMKVRSGWADFIVAGGVESMSRVPMGADGGAMHEDPQVSDAINFVPQGIGADLIATLERFSRQELDRYALNSQKRAATAWSEGRFDRSIIPIKNGDGQIALAQDEHMRPDSSLAGLAGLKPAFAAMGEAKYDAIAKRVYPQVEKIEHRHTAGNSSGIVDGAALILVGSKTKGEALGLKPRARLLSAAVVGSEPTIMLTGPAPASRKALQMAGMGLEDVDLIEVNEAFAAVVLKFMREMGLESAEHINVNGGAIALGHPLGATGAMLLGTALDELERIDGETALVTLCVGGGMGIAAIFERV